MQARFTAPGNSPTDQAALQRLEKVEGEVLALTAPDIDGVIEKLLIIWADEFEAQAPASEPLFKVIGDLRRLAALND